MLQGISHDLKGIVEDNPDKFTFDSVDDGIIEIKDFQTSGVVAFARGTPFALMESGTLSVAGQRVKINKEQLDQNRNIIKDFAARFW